MQTPATPGLPPLARGTVFVKTNKGRQEIAQRSAALNGKQRTVLIMLDGSKSWQAVATQLPAEELAAIVGFLRDRDFIAALDGPAGTPAAAPPATAAAAAFATPARPAATAAGAAPPQRLQEIKDYMRGTTRAHLGLMAADVIRKIDQAADTVQLMTVIGHWHMALHDSKYGKPFAALYLTQVKASLDGAALPPAPAAG